MSNTGFPRLKYFSRVTVSPFSAVKVSETKGTVTALKARMQSIEYDMSVLLRNYNDGLISEDEYTMRAVKLKNERLALQQKIFNANINLIRDMADTF